MKKHAGSATSDLLIQIIVTIVVLVIFIVPLYFWRTYQCSSYGDLTIRETKYTLTNGCFVKHNDKFIPRSELERRFIMNDEESK